MAFNGLITEYFTFKVFAKIKIVYRNEEQVKNSHLQFYQETPITDQFESPHPTRKISGKNSIPMRTRPKNHPRRLHAFFNKNQ